MSSLSAGERDVPGAMAFLDTKEQQDGYDLIEWIAAQPWSTAMWNDRRFLLGMDPVSGGCPEAASLKCIVPHDGGTDMYRDAFYQAASLMVESLAITGHWTRFFSVSGRARLKEASSLQFCCRTGGQSLRRTFLPEKIGVVDGGQDEFLPWSALPSRHCTAAASWPFTPASSRQKLLVEPETGYWAHLRFVTTKTSTSTC